MPDSPTNSFDLVLSLIGCFGFVVSILAVYSNNFRERKQYEFELKPNCLLTRHPIVFVTGISSLFYYRRYWNAFPVLLAEHGYEVFTLQLPWRGPQRLRKMKEFLQQHENEKKSFHFVMDGVSEKEFASHVAESKSVLSVTVPRAASAAGNELSSRETGSEGILVKLAYACHKRLRFLPKESSVADLGAAFPKGSAMLLERMQYLGEQDFLR